MPAHQGLGPDDRDRLENRWKPAIQLDEEQAIAVRELDPTAHLALQYNQLLFQRGVLCFKLALGLAFADSFMGQSEGRACEEPSRSFRSVTD